MRRIDKIAFGILGVLIILHAAFRMNGNDMMIQIVLGLTVALLPLFNKKRK